MKQGTALYRLVMILFFAAILLYFAGSAWRSLRDPYPTTQAYTYAVDDTQEATGYLVRTEEVITASGGIVRLLPAEGEKVPVGAAVATLYADELSVDRSDQLEALRTEAQQMEQAIAAAGVQSATDQSGQAVIEAMVALRSAVEAEDFTHLESRTTAFQSAVYQQALRHGSAGDLTAALEDVKGRIAQLEAQTAQSTGAVTVQKSGIFSGQVDGYESVLTPEILTSLSPSALDELDRRALTPAAGAVGKLITDSKWYFVCTLSEEAAQRLTEGGSVEARFSRDWSGEIRMTVERIGAPEGGRVAVILSSTRGLSQVTLLRRQTVDLVFSTQPGLRGPTEAVRMEDGQSVVYVQVGVTAERKPVTILAQGEDYYLVEPVVAEDAAEKQERLALRAGDAVIIASQEIWDGKIID